jgi:hypothetical protein
MTSCALTRSGLKIVIVNLSAAITFNGEMQSGKTIVGVTGPRRFSCSPCWTMIVAPGGIGPRSIQGTFAKSVPTFTAGASSGAGLPALKIRSMTSRWFRDMAFRSLESTA